VLGGEGLLDVEHGSGIFVRSHPPLRRLGHERLSRSARSADRGAFRGDLAAAGRSDQVEVEVRTETPPPLVAEQLGVSQDTQVLARHRVMKADDQPLQISVSYLPLDLVKGSKIEERDTGPGGIYSRLDEVLAQRRPEGRLDRFEEKVTTRMPLPDEARTLRLNAGVPILHVTRTAYDEQGTAVEICDMLLAGDRYELAYVIPAS
jgi:GntR family transcriptional regulator